MNEALRMEKRTGFCEGWNRRGPEREHCDGGPALWITRRALWIRSGYLQCGTCKRRDDERLKEEA